MQEAFYSLSIAIQTGDTKQTLANIEKSWNKIMTDVPFDYSFF
jgi:hypothetical protein